MRARFFRVNSSYNQNPIFLIPYTLKAVNPSNNQPWARNGPQQLYQKEKQNNLRFHWGGRKRPTHQI